jgi:predicted DsbA family dithiol-disulfide isomerase
MLRRKAMTTIDVISDVICPWCYVGKRRLEKAIALAGRGDVRVRWYPFQLNPNMPKAGMKRKEYRTAKFGSWERSLALDAQVTEAGRAEGIPFAFDKIERTPNTLDAHRLIWLAEQDSVQDAVVEAVFRAYFTQGQDITNVPTLLNVVSEAGLDRGRAEILLSGDGGVGAIRAAEEQAHRAGVRGVPFYVINGSLALSGARERGEFLAAFEQAAALPNDEGSACTIEPGRKPSC